MARHSHQNHNHGHSTSYRLWTTMGLNLLITVAELIGGLFSHSLSLISDALHNLSDGIAIFLTIVAIKLKKRKYSDSHTFGMKRAEILAALLNSGALAGICIFLFYESIRRLLNPSPVGGKLMTIVALFGLVANIIGTLLLKKIAGNNLNIRSAYLHLLSDALSSLGVVIGGLAIVYWQVFWIDPILTILIALYILKESYQILMQAVHILMEGAPPGISREKVRERVRAMAGVEDIHHIHLWMVGDGDVHFEAHVNVRDMRISESDRLRMRIAQVLRDDFSIRHITLQFEYNQCLKEQKIGEK